MDGTNVGSVFFDVGMDNGKFRKGIQSEGKFAENSLGKAFSNIGGMVVAAFSVKALTDFAMSAIDLASDLEEVQNVVDVTFGQGNQQIEQFAQSAMTSFGMSELSAKKYMGTMGAMLKSMGLSSAAVETMSMDMVGLAGDMASFYNLDGDDAFNKIRAGISGETEPLKQLGINMSVANMEAFALSQGITKSYNSMTQAEQALLRYNYLMSVTSDAQGDFVRTSDGWANQVRVLKLQWESFSAALGSAFIAILTPVIQGLNWLMTKLVAAANAFKSFVNLITGGKAQASNNQAASSVAAVGTAAETAGKKAAAGAKAAKGALAAFDELTTLSEGSGGGGGGSDSDDGGMDMDFGSMDTSAENTVLEETGNILDELKEKAQAFLEVWGLTGPFQSFTETCKKEFEAIKKKAVTSWETIRSAAETAFSRVVGAVEPLITPIGTIGAEAGEIFMTFLSEGIQAGTGILTKVLKGTFEVVASYAEMISAAAKPFLNSLVQFFSENGEQIKTRISEVWGTIETTVGEYIDSLVKTYQTIFGGFIAWFEENGAAIQSTLEGTWQAIWSAIDAVWTAIETVFYAVFGGISDFLDTHMTEISDTLVSTWNMIWTFIQPIWDTISSVCQTVFGGLKEFFVNNMGTLREIVSTTFAIIWTVIKTILDKVKAFWDKWGGTIMAAVNGVLSQIKTTFSTIWEGIKVTFETVLDVIKGVLNTVLCVLEGDWEGAWESIKSIFVAVWEDMKSKFRLIANFLHETFTNAKNTLSNVWDEILKVFKAPINTIIGWINKLISAWNSLSFKVPKTDLGPLGSFGGFTIGLPKINQIPLLAKGGIVDQPTLSVIGEAGTEAVVPLENNTGWMDGIADSMRVEEMIVLMREILDALRSGKTVELDKRVIGQVVVNSLESSFRAAGRTTLSV